MDMIVYTEFSSLSRDLGIPTKTLFAVSNRIRAHYRKVRIPKKSGGYRELSVPDEVLKRIQRAIAERILFYHPISRYARAYRFGASVQSNARPHVGKEAVLKLDIKHFFDSILYSTVKEKCFPKRNFSEPIRVLLSMLCYCGDSLPQGAPTSPIITNIIMRDFDETVGDYCEARGITYTRYCDDMTFSGSFDADALTAFVKTELFQSGYLLNAEKTVLADAHHRQTVTGLVVNERLGVPASYKREIRKDVYFCEKYGVSEHLRATGSTKSETAYLEGLLGRIAYVLKTEPNSREFSEYKETVTLLLKRAHSSESHI